MPGIADNLMGDVWPEARPGQDGASYGEVSFHPEGPFEVRSHQSLTFTIKIGAYGLDDTGAIKIVQRWTPDGGALQSEDPTARNYVSATASNGVDLVVYCEPYPHQRPWFNAVRVTVRRGYLSPGDLITVVYGDRSAGGPGFRVQTFPESAHLFKVLIDPCATGVFLPIGEAAVNIVPGAPHQWIVSAPTLCRPGQRFSLGIRVEDCWGNPTDRFEGPLRLVADNPVEGLPDQVEFSGKSRAVRIEDLSVAADSVTRFDLLDGAGNRLARSNPLLTRADGPSGYWGDLHGQSGETVGINTLREYFEFARDVAFLDVTSHQANDFQVTNDFWSQINRLSAEFNVDGRFVVFPGYEWSGNTPVGGDHNVFFRHEGEQIHRSSHALLSDRQDIGTDAQNLGELFSALDDTDCVVYAHVGGRPADISFAENARLRTAVEVHSDWGTFEWIMTDAFELGYRVGLVCNSDGHKGAPGACYPGASEFGAYSGLTCFLSNALTRDAIFDSLRARHHYGTTGCRMHLGVVAALGGGGAIYPEDPRLGSSKPVAATTAMMGDIVTTPADQVEVDIEVFSPAPIERIEVLNGADTVATLKSFDREALGQRICVLWEGAEYRGRGRTTSWQGSLTFDEATIERYEPINQWNIERTFRQVGERSIEFDAVTTGNFGGCHLWLDRAAGGVIKLDTNLIEAEIKLGEIGFEDRVLDAGGLGRRMRIFRLPDRLENLDRTVKVSVPIVEGRDNPVWVKITTEDGFNAWSSPIYVLG